MLADLEAIFRSLKSELGLRPIYHQKENRVNEHIFITLLAYHAVQTLRAQLKAQAFMTAGKQQFIVHSASQPYRIPFKKQSYSFLRTHTKINL